MSTILQALTPVQFETAKSKLAVESGLQLRGAAGTLESHGVGAEYTYDGKTLVVNVRSAPPFMMAHVVREITQWLQECSA
jgi:hypothetical protein